MPNNKPLPKKVLHASDYAKQGETGKSKYIDAIRRAARAITRAGHGNWYYYASFPDESTLWRSPNFETDHQSLTVNKQGIIQ